MIIGVPRERKTLEKRVALTPDGADALTSNGHTVLIEKNAGLGSSFLDDSYKAVGCKIVETLKEVWTESELVVKVKEPHESEYEYFRPGLALFDYLHLASMQDVTQALLNGGVTGIAYELVQLPSRRLPLLEPMSEVAGKISVLNGANYLLTQNGGMGLMLGGVVGTRRAKVTIVGAGVSGRNACDMAVGMGANVTLLDVNHEQLEYAKAHFGNNVETLFSTPRRLRAECEKTDLLIGAVLIPGAAAPKIITRDMIASMPKGSVFVDISIDQGGCGETSRPTSLDEPTYIEEGVIHYGVCNMPSQTALTSTMALTSATLPYLLRIANTGVEQIIRSNAILRNAVNTYQGKLTNEAVSKAVDIQYTPIDTLL